MGFWRVIIRNNGISNSKYTGEYSTELYNLILENNRIVKEYKKQVWNIKKELGVLIYTSEELTENINIDLARRNMIELIYKQAKLEGLDISYFETETIVNGGKVNDIATRNIVKFVNLKHTWEFIWSEGIISYPTNYKMLFQIII